MTHEQAIRIAKGVMSAGKGMPGFKGYLMSLHRSALNHLAMGFVSLIIGSASVRYGGPVSESSTWLLVVSVVISVFLFLRVHQISRAHNTILEGLLDHNRNGEQAAP
jgi:hypothetical protein